MHDTRRTTDRGGRAARHAQRAGRSRRPLRAVAAIVAGGLAISAIGLLVLSPRLTTVDRDRLRAAREVPYQTVNLVDHDAAEPRHYYVDMRAIVEKVRAAEYGTPALDADGIPLVDYTILGGAESHVHNPITTAQYALGLYEEYLAAGDDAVRRAFLSQADWLVSMQSDDGGFYYEFDVPSRSLEAPWLSAMAQGEGISVLVRAYYETGDTRYLEAAEAALGPLLLPMEDGGVQYADETGVWLEEYPTDPPSHVLNGMLFTMFGLHDLVHATGDQEAATLLEQCVDTIARNLDRYESDGWVLYELRPGSWATKTYYGLHIEQLRALAALTGDEQFEERADDWAYPLEHEGWWLAGRTVVRFAERLTAR